MIGSDVYVIAEIGINHEGDVEICAQMIEAAAKAGADAVKLQIVDADESYVIGTESHRLFAQASLSREGIIEMFALARNKKCRNIGDTWRLFNFRMARGVGALCTQKSTNKKTQA